MTKEIAFIDRTVTDLQAFLAGLRPEIEPFVLESSEPAATQMARAMRGRDRVEAIHIVAHGAPGRVSFGAGPLSLETLDEHAEALGSMGATLGPNAQVLLWACRAGEGERGAAFVDALARATGAPVAAAVDLVGSAALGGRWDLDAGSSVQAVRAPLTAEAMTRYAGVMADIYGTDGPNTLTDTSGDDYIYALGGNDSVIVSSGQDAVDGGSGIDRLVVNYAGVSGDVFGNWYSGSSSQGHFSSNSNPVVNAFGFEHFTVNTGSGDDYIDITIEAIGGNHIVNTGGGSDRLVVHYRGLAGDVFGDPLSGTLAGGYGGSFFDSAGTRVSFTGVEHFTIDTGGGNDSITTGDGDDIVNPGGGDDIVNTDAGNDSLIGGGGNAILNGGEDNDSLFGGSGNDTLNGDEGNDSLIGGVGNAILNGGADNDSLSGGSGNDTLNGDGGDDTIDARTGTGQADGGAGNDTIFVGIGTGQADGGTGEDGLYADLSSATTDITVNLVTNTSVMPAGTGTFTNFEYLVPFFLTGSGNDTIVTRAINRNEIIDTGSGNDTITVVAGGGSDQITAGSGTDRVIIDYAGVSNGVIGSMHDDFAGTLNGYFFDSIDFATTGVGFTGVEHVTVTTGGGADQITTGTGDVIVTTGAGDDTVNVGAGANRADGGTGEDGLSADLSSVTTGITLNLVTNSYTGRAGTSFTNFEYLGGLGLPGFVTGSGNDTIVTRGINRNDTIDTRSGNDTITITSGANGGGVDYVTAGSGTDRLIIDYAGVSQRVFGRSLSGEFSSLSGDLAGGYGGSFEGSFGGNTFFTGVEHFTISTGSGGDTITTGDGNDIVNTGAGNDTLNGGAGIDHLSGGEGNDVYYIDTAGDILVETGGAFQGVDSVRSTVSHTLGADFENLTLLGTGNRNGTGNSLDNVIVGNDYRNFLVGNEGNDTLVGGLGDDTLYGGFGNDFLAGTAGMDTFDYSAATGLWSLGSLGFRHMLSGDAEGVAVVDNGRDVLLLPGTPNDFNVSVSFQFAPSWAGTLTSVRSAGTAVSTVLDMYQIESVRFAQPIAQAVDLSSGSLVVEMAKLSLEVYANHTGGGRTNLHGQDQLAYETGYADREASASALAIGRKWHPMSALELGMKPADYREHGTLQYSLVDGLYSAYDPARNSFFSRRDGGASAMANAFVFTGVVEDKPTLVVAFRGTDQRADFDDYLSFKQHYDKFKPLIDALKSYLTVGGIQQILVTGHSLGGGMAQFLLREEGFSGDNVRAFSFGSPGSDTSLLPPSASRIQNFIHTDDLVALMGEIPEIQADLKELILGYYKLLGEDVAAQVNGHLQTKFRLGTNVRIDRNTANSYGTAEHDMSLYVDTMERLAMHAGEVGSPFRNLPFLDAFRKGLTNVAIDYELSLGSDGNDTLTDGSERWLWSRAPSSGPANQTVLAGGGNDTITLDTGGTVITQDTDGTIRARAYWRVDGGTDIDRLVIKRLDADNLILPGASGHILTYTVQLPEDVLFGVPLAEIHRVETLVLPNPARVGELVIPLDGRSLQVQRPGSPGGGAAADALADLVPAPDAVQFVLDPAFDYADAGDGDMTVTGTAQADIVLIGRGHKVVNAGDGDDIVIVHRAVGGSDRAAINGELGNDLIYAEDGADTLDGGVGDDDLEAGGGVDVVYGGVGADVIAGDGGNDELDGGDGNDVVNGGAGADRAVGAQGDDVLMGDDGNDQLSGGAGNDTLEGGAGLDTLTGGDDNDLYIVEDGNDVLQETAAGGTDAVWSNVDYTLRAGVEHLVLTGTALNGTGNGLANVLTANDTDNNLSGSGGEDTIDGSTGNDALLGGSGDDVLTGGAGNDNLSGGTGVDSASGGTGDDTYSVGSTTDIVVENAAEGIDRVRSASSFVLPDHVENLMLIGTDGNNGFGNTLANALIGNDGDNQLRGDEGNDTIDGGAGLDTLRGNAGGDLFILNDADLIIETSGAGVDLVQSSINYTLTDHVDNLTLVGASTTGTGNTLANVITGNGAANTLSGDAGNDTLLGSSGSDTLNGGAGNDSLDGGASGDDMTGGLGDDIYAVSTSDDVFENAGEGFDIVRAISSYVLSDNIEVLVLLGTGNTRGLGSDGDNAIDGNSGNNKLVGKAGNDVLDGGTGADTLLGGGGNDVLIWDAADLEIRAGSAQGDILRLEGAGQALDLTTIDDNLIEDVEVIDITGAGNNDLTLALADVLAISGNTDQLRIDGNAGDDVVVTGGGWTQGADREIGANTYHRYTQGAAILLIDTDILVTI